MMKWLGLMLSLCLLPVSAQTPTVGMGSVDTDTANPSRRGVVLDSLFSTFPGRPRQGFVTAVQEFTDPTLLGFRLVGADDFVVPEGASWNLQQVQVLGSFFDVSNSLPVLGPPEAIAVYIFADAGGAPDTTDLSQALFQTSTTDFVEIGRGDFEIQLPQGGFDLGPGRYWLAVVPAMSVAASGQWGWNESAAVRDSGTAFGFESQWFQSPAGIIGNACIDAWGRRITDCNVGRTDAPPEDFDLAFQLFGTEQSLVSREYDGPEPNFLDLRENGLRRDVRVSLTQEPIADVTIQPSLTGAEVAFANGTNMIDPLVFTPQNWDQAQTIALIAPLDDDYVPYRNSQLTFAAAASADLAFDGVVARSLDIVRQEVDCLLDVKFFESEAEQVAMDANDVFVAFTAPESLSGSGGAELEVFLNNRLTGDVQLIGNLDNGAPDHLHMSADGGLIAFTANREVSRGTVRSLFVYDRVADSLTSMVDGLLSVEALSGSRLFYLATTPNTSTVDVYIFDVETQIITQMTSGGGDVESIAVDGDEVHFARNGAIEQLTLPSLVSTPTLAEGDLVAAGGGLVIYRSDGGAGRGLGPGLYILEDGLPSFLVASSGTGFSQIGIQRDGRRFAYVLDGDLYVRTFGGPERRLTSGETPRDFATGGRDLVYTQVVDEAGSVYFARVEEILDFYPQWPVQKSVLDLLRDVCSQ